MKELLHTFNLFMKSNISRQNVYTYVRQEEKRTWKLQCSAVHCRGEGIWYNLARLQQLQFLLSWGNLCCCLIQSIVWHDFVQNIASIVLIMSILLNSFVHTRLRKRIWKRLGFPQRSVTKTTLEFENAGFAFASVDGKHFECEFLQKLLRHVKYDIPCPSFTQTPIQFDRWLLRFQTPSAQCTRGLKSDHDMS